jgi:hypothetical protein
MPLLSMNNEQRNPSSLERTGAIGKTTSISSLHFLDGKSAARTVCDNQVFAGQGLFGCSKMNLKG